MRKTLRTSFVLALLLSISISTAIAQQQPAPDWATRTFNAPAEQVFAAALRSIQQQKHEVKATDQKRMQVTFHVGTTAWAWGYNMMLTVDPATDSSAKVFIAVLAKSGGGALSWGSGKKEVRKVFA